MLHHRLLAPITKIEFKRRTVFCSVYVFDSILPNSFFITPIASMIRLVRTYREPSWNSCVISLGSVTPWRIDQE